MTDKELIELATSALKAQELLSVIQHEERSTPLPNDARYTEFIGEWSGYKAPELRLMEFATKRKALRKQFLRAVGVEVKGAD